VVCNRLLYFFEPADMQKAVRELCRVAKTPVLSIRTGKEGVPKGLGSYTHDLLKFFEAVGNRLVTGSHVLSKNNVDTHTMYAFRDFVFETDVIDQFKWHKGGISRAQSLADQWLRYVGLP